ncbi:hypothetical protein S7711_03724 [Stachybotrys chartarum IBT 7711]|uniref:CN hydrolase domain-containing protein n=1 Tax=Stachybotrys chartarum (strain CBS 109288 / IBT 7711) TaxID=1280523 RepID=A0A084AWR4_STACB|nr:hypothetical protein S7711_03724 [Stachybotrys chartarum IBT 7711]KFA49431.1 hypothetical protein S40293_05754 [Stachybotrys chartarum IBT 40293]
MRIGCLQFAPQLGDIDNNLNRADAVLSRHEPEDLDLLVLPELAFTGYNFKSLQEISPFLEPSGSGISSLWSRTTALKYDCTVITGYPEKVDPSIKWPTDPEYYNAAIVVNGDGETIANYRKSHLYYTDETWALEGSSGFYSGFLPGLGPTAMGICMDLNPYKFQTPWHVFEFAHHVLKCEARVVVVSMAWITQEDSRQFSRMPQEPDMNTLMYWITRLEPIIRAENDEEVIIVFANRTGIEDDCTYAGTSAVVGIKAGEVRLYGILGRGDKELLVVDTDSTPYANLVASINMDALVPVLNKPDSPDHHRSESSDTNISGKASKKTDKPGRSGRKPSPAPSQNSEANKKVPQKSTSTYRRDDLWVTVHPRPEGHGRAAEGPPVHTPTAPSPTPHSMRPRLNIPPVASMTQRYLDSHSPESYIGTPGLGTAGLIYGGEVKFFAPNSAFSVSPAVDNESRFSFSSMDSFQVQRIPASRSPNASRHTPATDTLTFDFEQENEGDRRRHSIRSDVSVWNDHQGRARSVVDFPPSIHESPYREIFSQAAAQVAVGEPTEPSKNKSMPERPSSPKSRHASRNRGQERSNSAAARGADVETVQRKLEHIASRAESASGYHTPAVTQISGAAIGQNGRNSSYGVRKQQYTPFHADAPSTGRVASGMSIPIAMNANTLAGLTDASGTVATSNLDQKEPEILQAVTMDRFRSNSESNRGRDGERSTTRTAVYRREPIRSNVQSNRQISRGRQPGTDSTPERRVEHSSRHGRQSSRAASNEPREPVDLTQFALIEEYPSPNCPVHGLHSRPASEQRNHSRTEERNRSRTKRPLSQHGTPKVQLQRPASHNATPNSSSQLKRPSHSRVKDKSGIVDSVSEPPTRLQRKGGRATSVSVAVSSQESSGSGGSAVASGSSGGSTQSSNAEPKTPKAMTLVYDDDLFYNNRQLTLRAIQAEDKVAFTGIGRPQSAMW